MRRRPAVSDLTADCRRKVPAPFDQPAQPEPGAWPFICSTVALEPDSAPKFFRRGLCKSWFP